MMLVFPRGAIDPAANLAAWVGAEACTCTAPPTGALAARRRPPCIGAAW